MRVAILSDIHGNLPALEAVLADLNPDSVDHILIAGDSTGGTHPVEVISTLRALECIAIRGNGEDYFIDYSHCNAPAAWYTSQQWATMRWSFRRLDDETLTYIFGLAEQIVLDVGRAAAIRVVHGSLNNPTEHLYPDRDESALKAFREAGLLKPGQTPPQLGKALERLTETTLICGHSHIPWKQEHQGRLAINPGSVGGPINGDPRAQYALLEWRAGSRSRHRWKVDFRAVPYDLAQVRRDYVQSGLLDAGGALAQAFLLSIETGTNVSGHLLEHIFKTAQQAGWAGGDVVPDDVWNSTVTTFCWPRM